MKNSTPVSVMPTECSNWAESCPTPLTADQPSLRIYTSPVPAFTLGSTVKNIPGFSTGPLPFLP